MSDGLDRQRRGVAAPEDEPATVYVLFGEKAVLVSAQLGVAAAMIRGKDGQRPLGGGIDDIEVCELRHDWKCVDMLTGRISGLSPVCAEALATIKRVSTARFLLGPRAA